MRYVILRYKIVKLVLLFITVDKAMHMKPHGSATSDHTMISPGGVSPFMTGSANTIIQKTGYLFPGA